MNSYLDKNKILRHKWIFSSFVLNVESLSKFDIPSIVWESLVGNLLGDGFLSKAESNKNSRIELTFASPNTLKECL